MDARELRARLKAFAIRVRPLTGHHEDTKIHEGHDLSSLFLPFEKRVRALRASSCLREEPSRGRQPESRVKYVQKLPPTTDAQEIGRQLIRAGTGVSANYHAAGRSRSRAEWIARVGVVLEEADEAEHWLDIMFETKIASGAEQSWLRDEASQLRAIFQKAVKTSRANHPIKK